MNNREIKKFRAWNRLNKTFTYWTMNDLCSWDDEKEKPSALDDWQQYTGLRDKNGKEIFEGDILHRNQESNLSTHTIVNDVVVKGMTLKGDSWSRTYEVINGLPNGWLSVKSVYPHKDEGMVKHNDWSTFEVIGNVFENPELLK